MYVKIVVYVVVVIKVGGCTGTQPNDCKPCTNCSRSQYETTACNHNHNRTCSNCINFVQLDNI